MHGAIGLHCAADQRGCTALVTITPPHLHRLILSDSKVEPFNECSRRVETTCRGRLRRAGTSGGGCVERGSRTGTRNGTMPRGTITVWRLLSGALPTNPADGGMVVSCLNRVYIGVVTCSTISTVSTGLCQRSRFLNQEQIRAPSKCMHHYRHFPLPRRNSFEERSPHKRPDKRHGVPLCSIASSVATASAERRSARYSKDGGEAAQGTKREGFQQEGR
jgi:hypothetical protein